MHHLKLFFLTIPGVVAHPNYMNTQNVEAEGSGVLMIELVQGLYETLSQNKTKTSKIINILYRGPVTIYKSLI